VFQPKSGEFTVELQAGAYQCEWFDPARGAVALKDRIKASGAAQRLKPPFDGQAVLYLKAE
jgi:hypothetical protein